MTPKNSSRVFFALWPREKTRNQLFNLSENMDLSRGERRIRKENIHFTLVFLGEITADQFERLYAAANIVRAKKFKLVIDRLCYWESNHLIYATTSVAPLELIKLVDALKAAMYVNGFSIDNRAFLPHITLVRNVRKHNSYYRSMCYSRTPITWAINEWILVLSERSSDGPIYKPIKRWTLVSPKDKYSFPDAL